MHIFIFLAILVAVIAVLILIFTDQPKQRLEHAFSNLSSTLQLHTENYAIPLSAWADNHLQDESELQSWLAGLSEEGLQALGENLCDFANTMELDLEWLMKSEETSGKPDTFVEGLVIDYCKLCMKAVQR